MGKSSFFISAAILTSVVCFKIVNNARIRMPQYNAAKIESPVASEGQALDAGSLLYSLVSKYPICPLSANLDRAKRFKYP
jgi:hypothetical protein